MTQDPILTPDVSLTQDCKYLERLSLDPLDKTPANIKAASIELLAVSISRNNINDSADATKAVMHGITYFSDKKKDPHRALRLTTAAINASPDGSNHEGTLIEKWHDLIALNNGIRNELYPHAKEAFSSHKKTFKAAAAPDVVELSLLHGITEERIPGIITSLKDVYDYARTSGDANLALQASQKLDIISEDFPEARVSPP